MKRLFAILAVAVILSGCHSIVTEPGMETVIVDNPWIFGHGGVRDETQKPGQSWYAITTVGVDISMMPQRWDEPLEHLATGDNNFINYQSYIVLQWHDPAQMVKKFGYSDWYNHNLKEQYRTIVRDVTKKYPMTKIMTDPVTLDAIEKEIAAKFRAHIETTGLHVTLLNVNMGKALPNESVIAEMDNTAQQQQRIKTEYQRKLAEDARKQAESSRAAADDAYRVDMHLDPNQFVQLELGKRYAAACEAGGCTVIVGSSVPIVVGK